MRVRPAPVRQILLMLALACLCAAAAHARQASAQESPAADSVSPAAGTTRKVDEYGKIGHCDETARLDNFAIELQNHPGLKGYLLVYFGKNDLPAWTNGILKRAAGYLVNSRGLEPGRIKVVNGGYREERTTELWAAPENEAPPQPSNAVEFTLDRTKSYKWDENNFNIAFAPDDTGAAEEGEEGADSEETGGEAAAAGEESDEEAADEGAPEAESAEVAEWRKEVEKYQISTVVRGVIESEYEPEESDAEAEGGDGAAVEAAAEPEGPPTMGEVSISLWWNVESLAEELKAAPDARLCLVFYWGEKNATQEMVKELVERALAKTVEQLGVKRDRLITIDGGRSAHPGIELWVVPPGAAPPRPTPEQKRMFGFYSSPGEE